MSKMSEFAAELFETIFEFQRNSEFMETLLKDPDNISVDDAKDLFDMMKQFNECCDKIKSRKVITFILNGGNNNGNND